MLIRKVSVLKSATILIRAVVRKPKKMNEPTKFIVKSNGDEINLSVLRTELEWARKMEWIKSIWKPKPALMEIGGKSSRPYIGQKFDSKYFEIKNDGWNHEHCDLCSVGIYENDDLFISENQIICESCHSEFIVPKNINETLDEMNKVER